MPTHNAPATSAYFGGGHRQYGAHQWCIKYYDWQDDDEIESAVSWAFGDYSHKTGTFDQITELLGRPVRCSIAGRSGGWFVVDEALTPAEVTTLDSHIRDVMAGLPDFLSNEREFHAAADAEAAVESATTLSALEADPRVADVRRRIAEIAGYDAVLILRGHRIV